MCDLRRAIQSAGKQVLETPIETFMTKSFISARKTMSAIEAMSVMNKGQKKSNSAACIRRGKYSRFN